MNWILERGEKKEEKRKEHFELKKRNLPKKEVNIGKGGEKIQAKAFQKILPETLCRLLHFACFHVKIW